MVTKEEKGGWINWEVVINIFALLYIKQVTNKDLLYSIGNYTQYFVITISEKNLEKNIYSIYIYIYRHTYTQPRQHIQKQRHYFAKKGPSSQGYGFSNGHGCESWTIKKAEH